MRQSYARLNPTLRRYRAHWTVVYQGRRENFRSYGEACTYALRLMGGCK
jgi:hypothetical protein